MFLLKICIKKKGDKTGVALLHLYFSLHGRAFWHSDWLRGESTKLLSIQRKLPESEPGDLNPVINTRFNMERKRRAGTSGWTGSCVSDFYVSPQNKTTLKLNV